MGDNTGIEWTHRPGTKPATWNPFVGCSLVSPGCTNCYAMGQAARIVDMTAGIEGKKAEDSHYFGTVERVKGRWVWTGKVNRAPAHIFFAPLQWKAPRTIFTNSMSDLWHPEIMDGEIDQVFAIMALAPQHTFQVLTKRSERMREYLNQPDVVQRIYTIACDFAVELGLDVVLIADRAHEPLAPQGPRVYLDTWPLPNVWLGVSTEDQKRANERIPDLLQSPAAIRFVSAEPLLGGIDFSFLPQDRPGIPNAHIDALAGYATNYGHTRLNLVIVGGESGRGARPLWTPDLRSIVIRCRAAGVPVFVKQLGANVQDRNDAGFDGEDDDEWEIDVGRVEHDLDGAIDGYQGAPVRIHLKDRKGGDPAEWPADLRVRQFPEVARG